MPDQPSTPAKFYEYYRYPSDAQLIEATNAMVTAYERYVWTMAPARMQPASMAKWVEFVIAMWETQEK